MREVTQVVAIDPERDPVFSEDEVFTDPIWIFDICSSLVTTREEISPGCSKRFVVLAHYSVKEYLTSTHIRSDLAAGFSMPTLNSNDFIARSCLGYLLRLTSPLPMINTDSLASYCARYWVTHAQASGQETESLVDRASNLLCDANPAFENWIQLHDIDYSHGIIKASREVPNPLYYASLAGLTKTASRLLDREMHVDKYIGRINRAFAAATLAGHLPVMELLLSRGADINAQDEYGENIAVSIAFHSKGLKEHVLKFLLANGARINSNTQQLSKTFKRALQAAEDGSIPVFEVLLESGQVDVNFWIDGKETALHWCARSGNAGSIRTLVKYGANLETFERSWGDTPLLSAIHSDANKVVSQLLDHGASTEIPDKNGVFPLMKAAISGNENMVDILLRKGARLDAKGGPNMETALLAAIKSGQRLVVKMLITNGANVDAEDKIGQIALLSAMDAGMIDMVPLLIEKSEKLDFADPKGKNILMRAVRSGREDIVEALVARDVNVDAEDHEGEVALTRAVTAGAENIIRVLSANTVRPDVSDPRGRTALMWAAEHNKVDIIRILIARGADVNARDKRAQTALMIAATARKPDAASILLANGTELDAKDKLGWTALMRAAEARSPEITQLLVEEGAQLDLKNDKGWTAIMLAVQEAATDIVRTLSRAGASLHHTTLDNLPLLHSLAKTSNWGYSSRSDRVALLTLLLDLGASFDDKDVKGRTALSYAALLHNTDMIDVLLEKGANINASNNDGSTVLMCASMTYSTFWYRSKSILSLLIQKGATVDATNMDGSTALMFAAANGSFDAVKLLCDAGAQVDNRDGTGLSPLMYASAGRCKIFEELRLYGHDLRLYERNQIDTVKFLVTKGSLLDAKDKGGWTAVMHAAHQKRIEMVKLLLELGTSLDEESCCTPEMRETRLLCIERQTDTEMHNH